MPTSARIANRLRPGTSSRNSPTFLPAVSGVSLDRPVMLPPGRGKLATTPLPTGSPAVANTIGIIDVACFAASTGGVLCVTITSTLSRTNSAAISVKRSLRPWAQRYSIVTLSPSLQPNSRNRLHKCGCPFALRRSGAGAHESDGPLPRLLPIYSERRRNHRTTNKRDEFPPPHGLTRRRGLHRV